jgi:hypothetical protein
MKLFFNAQNIDNPANVYVAWLDVMGTRNTMATSVKTAANFIFKFHEAVTSQQANDVERFPVQDGVYVTSPRMASILTVLKATLSSMADLFVSEGKQEHRCLVRGALAFGPVYFGRQITPGVSRNLSAQDSYKSALLVGIPVIQAYLSEREAPPFGLYIHESVRAFSSPGSSVLPFRWWKWMTESIISDYSNLEITPTSLCEQILNYLDWAKKHSIVLGYELDSIARHRSMTESFFDLLNNEGLVPKDAL